MKKQVFLFVFVGMCTAFITGCTAPRVTTTEKYDPVSKAVIEKTVVTEEKFLVEDKAVNIESTVYGFKGTFFDPTTGSASPSGEFGFGGIKYRSVPIEKGQPFYAKDTVYSVWGVGNKSQETTIWVGRASEKSVLTFEAVPGEMIRIGSDGVTTGKTTVTLTPVTETTKVTTTTTEAATTTANK